MLHISFLGVVQPCHILKERENNVSKKSPIYSSHENQIYLLDSKIEINEQLSADIYHMVLNCPEIAATAKPGQFIHIRCSDGLSPLLRRPISIAMADIDTGTIEIIYRVVGEGTKILARKKKGETLDIMGPLGKGFPIPEGIKFPAIVGGGIGVAPLLFLAKAINTANKRETAGIIFAGFSSDDETFGTFFMEDCGFKLEICTDDGSRGYKGFPTDLLEKYINDRKIENDTVSVNSSKEIIGPMSPHVEIKAGGKNAIDIIYACGPKPLLAKVKSIAAGAGIPACLSLEERMACGVGACLGCAVKSAEGGYMKVCKDGPVFEASQVEI